MSYNPYASDDADDDLFEDVPSAEEIHGHAVDGSLCNKCLRPHNFNAPPEIRASVIEMMKYMPEESVAQFLVEQDFDSHVSSSIANGWLHASSSSLGSGSRYPINKAIVEVLDEMTGGKVTALWRVHETERVLYVNHKILSQANNALEGIKVERDKCEHPADHDHRRRLAQTIHALEFICELAVERTVSARNSYVKACQQADTEPKPEQLIMSSKPEDTEDILTKMMLEQISNDIPENILPKDR